MAKSEYTSVVSSETIEEFERLYGQLKAFYDEISILSKKSPDGAMNKFKLRFINSPLRAANMLLGETYRPFSDFEAFPEDEMPTTSDVGMMLSQYINSMDRFKIAHTHWSQNIHATIWKTGGVRTIRADGRNH